MNERSQDSIPFGRRFGHSVGRPVDSDFPVLSRVALLHVLRELENEGLTVGWYGIICELERVARLAPFEGRGENQSQEDRALELLKELPWVRVFEFCERIYSKLLAPYYTRDGDEIVSVSEARSKFADEVNRILLEDNFAYTFSNGAFTRPGSRQFQSTSSAAQRVLVRPELNDARVHYAKALRFFEGGPNADYPNAAKEAIASLEAAVKTLFAEAKEKDVRKVLQKIVGTSETQVPPTVAKSVEQLYNFRGAATGVAHGGAQGGVVTAEIAELVLTNVAAFVIYFVALHARIREDLPF